ncbi:MAG: hypothetical protein K8S56_08040 [Candidatus Cloacimonetes bacterium]|nr:hypothetical protein [Candidatus Cloacimonadota bacterium]
MFALISAFICLLLGLVLFFFFKAEVNADNQIIFSNEQAKLTIKKQQMSHCFREVISDLKVIANFNEIINVANRTKHDLEGLTHDFYQFSLQKGLFDQIRYIDKIGMEIIRINYINGKAVIVPKDELLNKSERYYFGDMIALEHNDLYISPLDLKVLDGRIIQPLKPMIRFGLPIVSKTGKKQGIILLNYLAGIMISNLNEEATKGLGHFDLLNSEGYWLKGPEPEMEWGFMYEDRQDLTYRNKFPSEWEKIIESDSGQFLSASGLYTYETFYPLIEGQHSSTNSEETFTCSTNSIEGKEFFFKIISHVPTSILKKKNRQIFNEYLRLYLILLGFVLIATSSIAYFLENKRHADEERKKLIEKLQQALKEVEQLQGIIPICSYCKKIRDDRGVWNQLEVYIRNHSEAEFSHGICPECYEKMMKEMDEDFTRPSN